MSHSNGDYSLTSNPILSSGTATFQAVCCDSDFNCKLSNQVILTVNVCDSPDSDDSEDESYPSEDTSSYTCGVNSYCQSGTCPPSYLCEQIESLTHRWCACVGSGHIHPDWKPDGENYNPEEIPQDDGQMSEEEYASAVYCQQEAVRRDYHGGQLIYGDLSCYAYASNICYPYLPGITDQIWVGDYKCCMWNCQW